MKDKTFRQPAGLTARQMSPVDRASSAPALKVKPASSSMGKITTRSGSGAQRPPRSVIEDSGDSGDDDSEYLNDNEPDLTMIPPIRAKQGFKTILTAYRTRKMNNLDHKVSTVITPFPFLIH